MKPAVLALIALAMPVQAAPFDAVLRVDDETLAGLRGGFHLPNGTDVTIGVAIETRVDGALVLRTALTGASPDVQVFSAPGFGDVRTQATSVGQTVTLIGPSIELRHLIGDATGSVVANTANDRVVDTMTVVDVEVHDAAALAAPAMFQIEAIALDATARNQF